MFPFEGLLPDLAAELYNLLAQIPPGRVTTYGLLADALGLRAAARWVGEYLREHPHGQRCNCHRVVRAGGEVGLYVRGRPQSEKEDRLRREGIEVREGKVSSFEGLLLREFRSRRPLLRLIEFQEQIAHQVLLEPYTQTPPFAVGLDISYCRDGTAVGAVAVVESTAGELVWSTTVRRRAPLPYIPSLLTFRELPLLVDLYRLVRARYPELSVCFVDGNGILHPRRAGVAACFGVMADVRAIGVAKSLLCGTVESTGCETTDFRSVRVNGQVVGAAITHGRSKRPLYVSPAQRIDVPGAARLARAFHFAHRLPEPLYWADHLSRAAARSSASPASGAKNGDQSDGREEAVNEWAGNRVRPRASIGR